MYVPPSNSLQGVQMSGFSAQYAPAKVNAKLGRVYREIVLCDPYYLFKRMKELDVHVIAVI